MRGFWFVAVAPVLLVGCNEAQKSTTTQVDKPEKPSAAPEADCTARAAIDAIRDKVFDGAVAKVEQSEAVKLNSLRSVVAGRIESPAVANHDPAIKRTECRGRFIFGLPPNTQKAFNGATQLFADVAYAVQPAADKSGLVVEVTGAESIVDSLIQGAKRKRSVTVAAADTTPPSLFDEELPPPPTLREFGAPIETVSLDRGPSFKCTAKLNRVERTVCDDDGLSDLDRMMAEAYRSARERTPPEAKAKLEALRLQYLARRNRCPDAPCIADTYDAWTTALYEWNP